MATDRFKAQAMGIHIFLFKFDLWLSLFVNILGTSVRDYGIITKSRGI